MREYPASSLKPKGESRDWQSGLRSSLQAGGVNWSTNKFATGHATVLGQSQRAPSVHKKG